MDRQKQQQQRPTSPSGSSDDGDDDSAGGNNSEDYQHSDPSVYISLMLASCAPRRIDGYSGHRRRDGQGMHVASLLTCSPF